ncbi:hypothetical protein MFLAVUS_006758 [Mucor flavus]|uniref:Uncharacterized protein n=1 Tax=Mucor flavus TaxID=439312 RepID=A0ABP9Z2G8_9FUNG
MASSQVGNISISRTDAQKLNYFLKKAAKNGSANACMSLADCYEKVLELEGNIESAYCIGGIYYNAKGVKNDCKLALHYFKLTGSLNNRDVYDNLKHVFFFTSEIFEHGIGGVPQDYIPAHPHYEKVFVCGEIRATFALMKFCMESLGSSQYIKLTTFQILVIEMSILEYKK